MPYAAPSCLLTNDPQLVVAVVLEEEEEEEEGCRTRAAEKSGKTRWHQLAEYWYIIVKCNCITGIHKDCNKYGRGLGGASLTLPCDSCIQ